MNNPMLYQAGGALAVLAFLVFLFLCARTWRIWHVIFTFCVFACAIAFVILAAMTLKTRQTFKTQHEQLTKTLENLEKDLQEMRNGELLVVRQTKESMRSVRGLLERALVDRGRVWRNCIPTNVAPGLITLDTYRPDPADPPEAAAAANNQMQPKTTVYGFMEVAQGAGAEPWLLYMGEYTAESATPTTVSLKPLTLLDPVQRDAISRAVDTTWSLYEIVPRDGHRAFAVDYEHQPDLGENGASLYGAMDDAAIDQLFGPLQARYMGYLQARLQQAPPDRKKYAQQILDTATESFKAAIESHKKDGAVVANETDYATSDLWVKVRFLQDYTVDVDARANLGAISSEDYFDAEGRAQVADLQRGERDDDGNFVPADAEFEADDVAVFHKEAADQLIADGVCQQVDSVYVRPLHDFDYAFRNHVERMSDLNHDVRLCKRDIVTVTDANAKLQQQIDVRSTEKGKLELDVQGVDDELDKIQKYRQRLQQEYAAARASLSNLYRANKDKADQLRKLQLQRLSQARQQDRAKALARGN